MSIVTDRIRSLLSQGELEEGLQTATEFLRGRNDDLYDECIQHQGKISENNRSLRLGIIPQSDVELTRARVRNSLLELVRIIEKNHPDPAPTAALPVRRAQEQPPLTPSATVAAAPISAVLPVDEEAAAALLHALFAALAEYRAESAVLRATPLLHRSLLVNGLMQPVFRDNNFYPAHQVARLYCQPVQVVQRKSTNRKSIGVLNNREEGEEYVYTLAKSDDTGGMPGMVRMFFSKNGGQPTITNISL